MPALQKSITKGAILNLSSNVDVYKRGEKYYRDGKLLSYASSEDTNSVTTVQATVEGHYKNYEVSLSIDHKGALSNYSCSCESHSIWRGACKHVVAVLFANFEGHSSLFNKERMRQHARQLTDNLENIIYEGIDESLSLPIKDTAGAGVKLAPVLHLSPQRGIYLTFTVGKGRMYVVKSISSFVKSMHTGETISYGQGLSLAHKREVFEPRSQKLIDLIMREDDMYNEVSKRLSRQYQFSHHPLFASRELYITGRNIDDFFEIFNGQEVDSGMAYGQKIELTDGVPPISIDIKFTPEGLLLNGDEFKNNGFLGAKYYYFLTDTALFRLPKADGKLLALLLKSLDDAPGREILISDKDANRFLTLALPQFKNLGVVGNMQDVPEGLITAPATTKIYFDTEGRSITARLEFIYNNENATPDIVAEYTMKRRLTALGFVKKDSIFKLSGSGLIYNFLHGDDADPGIEELKLWAEVYVSEDLQKKSTKGKSPKIGLRLTGDLLRLSFEDTGYDVGELLEALEAYRTKKKFFRLKDGRFLTLDDEKVSAAADFLEALDITKKDVKGKSVVMPAYRALYIDELTRMDAIADTHALKRDKKLEEFLANFKDSANLGFKVPNGLGSVLREYQKTGYNWLRTLAHYNFGGILADDMGLGKTLQVIALLLSERKEGQAIVICPTSLLYNWENEIAKFAPKLTTQVVSGMPEKRRELLKKPGVDVLITTYDILKRDIDSYNGMDFSYIIADEAQNIKNPSTQAARSIKELQGRVRFALTGTPIENNLTELWSIFDFIMPGYLHTAHKFGRLYETPIVKSGDRNKAGLLRQQIAPFVMRRIKESVLTELPEKTETTLPAELTPEQKKIYQANLLETIGVFDDILAEDSFSDNRMRILAQLTRLRQICCHPALFLEEYNGGSGKLDLAIETIQLSLDSGHRVLLFSQFTGMLELIRNALAESKTMLASGRPVEYFYLDGSIKAKERMEMTSRFNEGERDLFLISLKAGGTGLNLTGADVVIHFDPWWNPSVMDQASDRAHRYGQKNTVQVFNIVAKDSIEEKIMALQEKKRDLIDSVITEGGSFINLLTPEEVMKLFTS
ncbi:MAG: DEAD/DEAH box helicase [Defluviitaleaceae bacterium]|nr:DEAD/DEAH box helicase [Defluviitaleaceae bacterium]